MDNESKRDKEIGSQVGKWNCKLFSSKVGYEGGGRAHTNCLKLSCSLQLYNVYLLLCMIDYFCKHAITSQAVASL
jgi:hypothetical protein